MTSAEITKEALELPAESRVEIIDRLLESLAHTGEREFQDLWLAEAVRRRDEIQSGKVKPIPAEEVFAEARRMLGA